MAILVVDGAVDMLVVCHMRRDVPLLVNKVKVLAEFLPASITLAEGEIFPKLLIKELVNGGIGIDAGTRITVPVPNTARRRTLLVDFDLVT